MDVDADGAARGLLGGTGLSRPGLGSGGETGLGF